MKLKAQVAHLTELLVAPTMPQLASVTAGMNELLRGLPSWNELSLQERFAIAAAATVSAATVGGLVGGAE